MGALAHHFPQLASVTSLSNIIYAWSRAIHVSALDLKQLRCFRRWSQISNRLIQDLLKYYFHMEVESLIPSWKVKT